MRSVELLRIVKKLAKDAGYHFVRLSIEGEIWKDEQNHILPLYISRTDNKFHQKIIALMERQGHKVSLKSR